jgi:hypothetical protein
MPAAIAAVADGVVVVELVACVPRRVLLRNLNVIQVLQHLQDNVKQKPRREQDAAVIQDRVVIAGSMGDRYHVIMFS